MNKKFIIIVAIIMAFAFVGCNKKTEVKTDTELFGLSETNNMVVDKEAKTIKIFALANGKYLSESTRHGVVSDGGKFADKAVFRSFVKPADFHQALLDIGAVPGNNMNKDNAETTLTEGSNLKLTFTWKDQESGKDINDVITDSNGNPIQIRFSGNLDNANEKKTGCITCLDSCLVGITSNASYPYGSVEKAKTVEFNGNMENFPLDGEPVVITYEVVE